MGAGFCGCPGNQGLPHLLSWAPEDLPTKYSFEMMTVAEVSSSCVAGSPRLPLTQLCCLVPCVQGPRCERHWQNRA